eukprot:9289592-Pyramimonas_sp.AAC.1
MRRRRPPLLPPSSSANDRLKTGGAGALEVNVEPPGVNPAAAGPRLPPKTPQGLNDRTNRPLDRRPISDISFKGRFENSAHDILRRPVFSQC